MKDIKPVLVILLKFWVYKNFGKFFLSLDIVRIWDIIQRHVFPLFFAVKLEHGMLPWREMREDFIVHDVPERPTKKPRRQRKTRFYYACVDFCVNLCH